MRSTRHLIFAIRWPTLSTNVRIAVTASSLSNWVILISAHLRHNQQSLKRPNCNLTSVLSLTTWKLENTLQLTSLFQDLFGLFPFPEVIIHLWQLQIIQGQTIAELYSRENYDVKVLEKKILQLSMVMLMNDALGCLATWAMLRKNIPFAELAEGNIESRSCQVCSSNLSNISKNNCAWNKGVNLPSMLKSQTMFPWRQAEDRTHHSSLLRPQLSSSGQQLAPLRHV